MLSLLSLSRAYAHPHHSHRHLPPRGERDRLGRSVRRPAEHILFCSLTQRSWVPLQSHRSPTWVQPQSNPGQGQSRLVKASPAKSSTFEKKIIVMNPSASISDNQRLNSSFRLSRFQSPCSVSLCLGGKNQVASKSSLRFQKPLQFRKPILGNFNLFKTILAFLTPSPLHIFMPGYLILISESFCH